MSNETVSLLSAVLVVAFLIHPLARFLNLASTMIQQFCSVQSIYNAIERPMAIQ